MIHLEIVLSPYRRAELRLPERLTEAELERLQAAMELIRHAVLIEDDRTPPAEEEA